MDNQQELFIIVNKKDQVVGYKTRYDCHHNHNLIHRAVDVIIFNKKGEILLQKRSKNKDLYPGLFGLSAAGHVGKGESYLLAAKRELREELGVTIPLKKIKKYYAHYKQESEMTMIFSGVSNGPFTLNEEVRSVNFVSVDKIKLLIKKLTPGTVTSLKKIGIL